MSRRVNIKSLIKNQLPSFVREDHSTFVAFLEAYYEWLDSNPDKIRTTNQVDNVFDIDESLELFTEDFQKTYISSFPISLAINPETGEKINARKLIKNIRSFYKAKGIEKSYRFLFRIIYNSDIEIYYPKNYIMNLSDGRWISEKKMYIKPSGKNSLLGKTISQRQDDSDVTSQLLARARVTNQISYRKGTNDVVELTLEEIYGTFTENSSVYDYFSGQNYGEIYSVLSNITINNQGTGYEVNQRINFNELSERINTYYPEAYISRVSPGSEQYVGRVLELFISDPGLNINSTNCGISGTNPINQFGATGGTGFGASANFGPIFNANSYYIGTRGLLSSDMVMQDNNKYQAYSYVIKSELSLNKYKELVKTVLHPAGTEIFSEILIKRCLQGNGNSIVNIPRKTTKRIGNYAAYTFLTYDNLGKWFAGQCYSPLDHDSLIICGTADCATGNPISSEVAFAAGATCLTADLPAGFTPDYWVIYNHPNTTLGRSTIYIHEDQLDDFYGGSAPGSTQSDLGWLEWNLSFDNGGTAGQQISWLDDILNNEESKNLAVLFYENGGSSFRKISIGDFINSDTCTYDCRYSTGCLEEDLT